MNRPPSIRTSLVLVLGFFLAIGVLEGLSFYIGAARAGHPVTVWRTVTAAIPSLVMQLSLAGPVALLSRHARIGPRTWARSLPLHALGALLFVAITMFGTAFIFKQMGRLGSSAVNAVAVEYIIAFMGNQVAVYAVMVGMFHALDFMRESEQRERERARLAASLTEARLNGLRSQLSPHFFFNTLNAISTFALQGRPDQVGDMVGALGDLMRVSLDDELPHQVPLRRELELLDLYLEIQRMRFADWLRIEQEVDPAAAEVLVPSLVLQPLVENAIEHGGQDADGFNVVRIRCVREGDALLVEIENRAPDRTTDGVVPRLGVGIRNTRERLEQLYPGTHEFRTGVVAGRGFVTELRIPVRRANAPAVPAGA